MSIEEIKGESNKECLNCKCKMQVSRNTFPVELSCKHILCFKCVVNKMPQDQTEIQCQICELPQKLKQEMVYTLIKDFRQEQYIPLLKCKTHSKDSLFFCKQEKKLICSTCLPNHLFHYDSMIPSTNEDLNSILDKTYAAILEQNKFSAQLMQKIEDLKKVLEFDYDKVQTCFKNFYELTQLFKIYPGPVELIKPYLEEKYLQSIIDKIEKRNIFSESEVLQNFDQKDQLHEAIKELVPNLDKFQLLYSSNLNDYDAETIYEKCQGHSTTLLLIKSSKKHKEIDCQSKILGGLVPVEIKNYQGHSDLLPDNSSFLFFYDQNKLRKCPQNNQKADVYSGISNRIIGFGQDSTKTGNFAIGTTKENCFASISLKEGGYSFPDQADMQIEGNLLNFSGNPDSREFSLNILEIYAVKTN